MIKIKKETEIFSEVCKFVRIVVHKYAEIIFEQIRALYGSYQEIMNNGQAPRFRDSRKRALLLQS